MGARGIWWTGVIAWLLVFAASVWVRADWVQDDVTERANQALLDSDHRWGTITVDGRDATLSGVAPDPESIHVAAQVAESVWGVRVVDTQAVVAPVAVPEPVVMTAATTSATTSAGSSAFDASLLAPEIRTEVPDPAIPPPAGTASTEWTQAIERGIVRDLAKVDPAECQRLFDQLLSRQTIRFDFATTTIHRDSEALLFELATHARRCPDAELSIIGHTDTIGDQQRNIDLSLRRAAAVVEELARLGVARARMTALGYGSALPVASNDTEEGRAKNRRIEFEVKD